jgi:cell division protein FtsW
MQGLYAIGSGGIFGKGLGSSLQKKFVPEAQNDMIFTLICEELGMLGAVVLILMYILLLWRMFKIANLAKDKVGSFVAIGVMAHIALQVGLNIAVATNSIPNTGVTLPFISAGGSSLWMLMFELGVVLNVSRSARFDD